VRLLEVVAADPARPIGSIDLLDPAERRQLLTEWNDTAQPVPAATLPALFEAQVARTPEATALVFEDEQLSYADLNARANRLAHHLIGLGAGPETIVALALKRSPEMVVTLLAILKAGAAYLPLDPDYPQERLAFMLQDAGPAALVTAGAVAEHLPAEVGAAGVGADQGAAAPARLLLDDPELAAVLAAAPDTDPTNAERAAPLRPDHPAYVIYTSGSTGRPKGVVVP
ncbi:MAG: hypothetical protein E5W94_33585, partial [Mesorhizobium sp.]